ncbi:hypothetical protein JJJ17_11415 [Paracoccus caeni]|uniref:Uncharacterized protein n=1 Tax=Paracoccus caeni TaxID=657651 RepID=A0A934SFM4_9RHOB|nr:hypothetical protein [Paracoccus caeni]MBK4216535.1 hypothetical protein [Paracoccus caeni]
MRIVLHFLIVALLTILTQIGGIAWLLSLWFRRRFLAFAGIYLCLMLAAQIAAPAFGRVAMQCGGDGPLRMQSWFYCLTNRNYVTPPLAETVTDLARDLDRARPGTVTLVLDGNFPFVTGFPLIPHLSHDDGRKLDLAFFYQDSDGQYQPGLVRSPIGYFAFEEGRSDCPRRRFSLRWDLAWLQPLFPEHKLDQSRMRDALRWLARDPRVSKVFLEPHLRDRLGVVSGKFRFQGCWAARHDDHIHFEI